MDTEEMEDFITFAEESELSEILELQRRAFRISAAILGKTDVLPLRQTLDDLREESRTYTILKYVSAGVIAGTIRGKVLENGNCYVAKLAVDPSYQNKGIGRKLLSALESQFSYCRGFELITSMDTPNTVHLYKSAGYEITRISIDDVGITLLHFEKRNKQYK